ncbi:MFS transporter [Rhizobium nepotum]|uniref:MFS transporter n=1 Tax=Rhizobium nepotum TaxID=1035271 RepID=UPI003CFBBB2A
MEQLACCGFGFGRARLNTRLQPKRGIYVKYRQPTRAAAVQSIPLHKLLLMGGLGYMFEAIDAGIIAFLLPSLRSLWNLTSVETGLLASATYIGFLVGALIAGAVGDRYGRRNVMMWALVLFCTASLASAFVNDWHSFFVLRAIGGIGMGAEAAIIAPYLSEFVGAKHRGGFDRFAGRVFLFRLL